MPVDREIQLLLDFLAESGNPPMSAGTAEQARTSFRTLSVAAVLQPAGRVQIGTGVLSSAGVAPRASYCGLLPFEAADRAHLLKGLARHTVIASAMTASLKFSGQGGAFAGRRAIAGDRPVECSARSWRGEAAPSRRWRRTATAFLCGAGGGGLESGGSSEKLISAFAGCVDLRRSAQLDLARCAGRGARRATNG